MENARIVSEPTKETIAAAEKWQKEQADKKAAQESLKSEATQKREPMKIIKREPLKIIKKEDIITNQQLADMPEFQAWCTEKNIEASKRQAGKHREEFEKYLKAKESEAEAETVQHKEAA